MAFIANAMGNPLKTSQAAPGQAAPTGNREITSPAPRAREIIILPLIFKKKRRYKKNLTINKMPTLKLGYDKLPARFVPLSGLAMFIFNGNKEASAIIYIGKALIKHCIIEQLNEINAIYKARHEVLVKIAFIINYRLLKYNNGYHLAAVQ